MPRPNILNFFFKICVTDNSGSPYGGQILWWDGRPASRADAETTRVVSIDLNSALKKLFFVQRSISTTKLNSYPPSPPSRTEFLAPKIFLLRSNKRQSTWNIEKHTSHSLSFIMYKRFSPSETK